MHPMSTTSQVQSTEHDTFNKTRNRALKELKIFRGDEITQIGNLHVKGEVS